VQGPTPIRNFREPSRHTPRRPGCSQRKNGISRLGTVEAPYSSNLDGDPASLHQPNSPFGTMVKMISLSSFRNLNPVRSAPLRRTHGPQSCSRNLAMRYRLCVYLCRLCPLSVNRRFCGTYRLQLQSRSNMFRKKPASKPIFSTLKMEAMCSSGTSGDNLHLPTFGGTTCIHIEVRRLGQAVGYK
jgi:hypothetical protein